ncbi:hypothetical protein OK351_05490 [Glutamicibacter sp. MNS18]|uniref:hypothetical protein n=1 Tax=Glutamicibacter sp. MNS18 TaxID=2989817 RepID=UPI002236A357|nr:hypothetical protein [Glutamicibacter sp. MNS18]MCW4464957.1 hypothetical protein [Glutamicibacter sp. MNS18]
MDAVLGVTIVAAILTALGLVIPLLSYLKPYPKKILEYRVEVIPLMRSAGIFSQRLKVFVDGSEVQEPYALEIGVRSVGRVDIKKRDFDGKEPLVFHLGDQTKPIDDILNSESWCLEGNRLELRPRLIARQNGENAVRFLCSGEPDVRLQKPLPLADTTVKAMKTSNERSLQKSKLAGWAGLAVVLVTWISYVTWVLTLLQR